MKISVILFDFVGVLLVPDPCAATTPLVDAIDARIGKVIDMDDSEENVAGARQVGMQGMYWETPEKGFNQFKRQVTV